MDMLGVPSRAAESPAASEPRPPIRIVLADDSFLAREAIEHLLAGHPRLTVVGECDRRQGSCPRRSTSGERMCSSPRSACRRWVTIRAFARGAAARDAPRAGSDRAEHVRRGGIRADSVRAQLRRRARVPAKDRIRNRKQLVDAVEPSSTEARRSIPRSSRSSCAGAARLKLRASFRERESPWVRHP